ncbi:DUF4307 domain-containing protein [Microbacterium sp. gxy059]|uniref:DUF4307 domain-containing protein n=1 Tax=Microbacterium sp. gxy059 TaxID=2957199 RepID=UPI003D97AD4A
MTTQEQLDIRYGRARRLPRGVVWTLLGAAGAAMIGVVVWISLSQSLGTVDYDDLGFEVRDESAVEVRFQVTSAHDAPVACVIEAQDRQHGIVGWQVVEYPPSSGAASTHTETIPTVAEATTGFVNACWLR